MRYIWGIYNIYQTPSFYLRTLTLRYVPPPSLPRTSYGVWLNLSPSRDPARRNTAHAWTDGPPPATFTV